MILEEEEGEEVEEEVALWDEEVLQEVDLVQEDVVVVVEVLYLLVIPQILDLKKSLLVVFLRMSPKKNLGNISKSMDR